LFRTWDVETGVKNRSIPALIPATESYRIKANPGGLTLFLKLTTKRQDCRIKGSAVPSRHLPCGALPCLDFGSESSRCCEASTYGPFSAAGCSPPAAIGGFSWMPCP
jgi:hypothetical protein